MMSAEALKHARWAVLGAANEFTRTAGAFPHRAEATLRCSDDFDHALAAYVDAANTRAREQLADVNLEVES